MKVSTTFKIAIRALMRNLMRAMLTMLGIIIGVSAVIAMMEIGQGSSKAIQSRIASMGANNLMVQPGQAASGGVSWGAGSAMTLTPDDCEAIASQCPAVKVAAPTVRSRNQPAVYGNKNWVPNQITGTAPEFLEVRDWTEMADGEMFTERDVRNANKVCVLGQTLVRELFGGESPVGKEIRIKNVTFKVVGALRRKGANMMGFDQDDLILAPWTTIKYRLSNQSTATDSQATNAASDASQNTLSQVYPQTDVQLYPDVSDTQQMDNPMPVRFTNIDSIMVAARSGAEIPSAIDEMTQLLRERHRLRAEEPDDFNIRNMTEMSDALASTTQMMTRLLLFVASISLLVGGVGIMNIMLVSVTERTREIGLRMAVGARAVDILQQFLVEAVVLCLSGGIVGILIGRGISLVLRHAQNWPTETSVAAIVASVVVAAGVGIIFGFYPAWKASRLDPIEALRYE
jgi:ABC-type antimicrobial peptide transport system permease subunit